MRGVLDPFEVIFALGGKSAITILYSEGAAVPEHCRIHQLSIDVRDLGRTYATPLSCVGDIRVSLRHLLPILNRLLEPRRDAIAALRARANADRASRRAAHRDRVSAEIGRAVTSPFVACAEVLRGIGPEVAIVDEAASLMPHTRALLDSPSWRQYSSCRGGGLGWGMPAAVGMSLGLDRNPVVSLLGDGASMYSPQALWTAANEQLPVTFVVLNNRGYRILKNFMAAQSHYLSVQANRYIAMDLDDPAIDFGALARSMGVSATRIERATDIAAAVEAGIASGRPNLIEIPISAE